MAVYGRLNISFTDYLRKSATTHIRVPIAKATLANAKKVADWIKGHSDAAVSGYGATLDYDDSCDTGKYDRVLQSLVMLFENQGGIPIRFSIPAPRDEDVSDDQEPVSDLPEDVMDLLKEIGAITSAVYNGGGLRSRLPSKEARNKEVTGV
jgi:hypothetical protein